MKAFLENFAAILGAASAAILAMSWSHEYGYFSTIGRQFQTFLTTGDYITNGVLWLPLAVLFVYQTVSWTSLAVEPKDQKPKIGKWLNRVLWLLWICWAAYMIATITWPLEYPGAAAILIFVVSFWSTKWRKVYANLSLEEPFQAIARELIRLGPPILIGMYLYGSTNATDDLTRSVYLFKFKDEKAHPQLYIFLRNFERGVLARDAVENRTIFLKWDDIKEISVVAGDRTNSLGCALLSWECRGKYKDKIELP